MNRIALLFAVAFAAAQAVAATPTTTSQPSSQPSSRPADRETLKSPEAGAFLRADLPSRPSAIKPPPQDAVKFVEALVGRMSKMTELQRDAERAKASGTLLVARVKISDIRGWNDSVCIHGLFGGNDGYDISLLFPPGWAVPLATLKEGQYVQISGELDTNKPWLNGTARPWVPTIRLQNCQMLSPKLTSQPVEPKPAKTPRR